MTQDEIIRMAREAGLICESSPVTARMEDTNLTPYLERFSALVAAHEREVLLKDNPYLAEQLQAYIHIATTVEREACAKVCDELQNAAVAKYFDATADECAAAIRARGDDLLPVEGVTK